MGLNNHPKTIAFWKEFNDSCKSWNSNSLLIGEVWDAPESIVLYKDKLDMCFEFGVANGNLYSIKNGNPDNAILNIEDTKTTFNPNQCGKFAI